MEDPHEKGENGVEDNPRCQEILSAYTGFREAHGGEEEGDCGEKKAWFLMGDKGEENRGRNCGEKREAWLRETSERQEE